jgi:hypothetical protein
MKVKQIVSEHKKGVRAHIYNKKATTKAQGPVPLYGPGKQDAKLKPVKINEAPEDAAIHAQVAALSATNPQFAAEVRKVPPIMRGMSGDSAKHNAMVLQQLKSLLQKYSGNAVQEEMPGQMVGKVQQVKPDGTVDIQKPSGDTTTVQATALQPGDNNKLTMQVPKIQPGQEVDASKTIEEEPTNDPQMDQMKQLMSQAKTPWEKRHWEERIKIRQNQGDTVDIGGGLPVQSNGQLLPVEPDINKWIQKNPTYAKDMPYDALPPGMKQPGIVDQGISRLKQLINYK